MQKNSKYLIIDTETTGFHPYKNGLIQLAAAALDSKLNIINTFCCDVKPPDDVVVEQESLDITGFTIERIAKGISYKELCTSFLDFIETNFDTKPIVIAQFYPFDYAFLDYVFTISGYEDIVSKDILGNDFIDTKALVNFANLSASLKGQELPFKKTSLSKPGGLKETLQIKQDFKSHDALGDVLATREVLIKLVDFLNF